MGTKVDGMVFEALEKGLLRAGTTLSILSMSGVTYPIWNLEQALRVIIRQRPTIRGRGRDYVAVQEGQEARLGAEYCSQSSTSTSSCWTSGDRRGLMQPCLSAFVSTGDDSPAIARGLFCILATPFSMVVQLKRLRNRYMAALCILTVGRRL